VTHDVAIALDVHPTLLPLDAGHEVRCWLYHDAAGHPMPNPPDLSLDGAR
jgi:hypothetical protein